jgi:FeS assembly SUF system regulator
MLKISKLVDYSVLVLCELASDPTESWSANRLADRLGLNQPTLAKICRLLSKAGLLRASRGAQGGYVLDEEPHAISLSAVIEAVDGDNELVICEKSDQTCPCLSHCHLQSAWLQIDLEIKSILQRKTIADFIRLRGKYCPFQAVSKEIT